MFKDFRKPKKKDTADKGKKKKGQQPIAWNRIWNDQNLRDLFVRGLEMDQRWQSLQVWAYHHLHIAYMIPQEWIQWYYESCDQILDF